MGRRQDFHEILVSQFEAPDTPCVKYQPGPSITLTYPAIVYKLDDMPHKWANNMPYHWDHRYEVKIISRKPDIYIREKLMALPMCRFVRAYTADNLYHYVFAIYY